MKPNEIRAEMMRRQISVTSIAKRLGMKQPTISQVIYGVRSTATIRQAIADAIGKEVTEIWPEKAEGRKKDTRPPDAIRAV